jgi:transglutaminase-like putative cysteine protease
MQRRRFLATAGATVWGVATVRAGAAQVRDFDPRPGPWRRFEVTTRVEVKTPAGVTRVWVPLPAVSAEYQRPGASRWTGNAAVMQAMTEPRYGAAMLYAEFAEGERPVLEVTSRVDTRSRAVDWSRPQPAPEDRGALARWLEPTELLPVDGIVAATARDITRGRGGDLARVRALYDWILDNTYREPKVRGCGVGDIRAMLETRNFGGKCGDINALFVGLARAAGVPARDVYGIRLAPSEFGYRALGAAGGNITRAQHCRAEVYLADFGWVAMDPADVGKVAREETGERLPLDHPLVRPVARGLFGAWEGNWLAYNVAHDVVLPRATVRTPLGFFMYPQAETAEGRLDSLDPDGFSYSIEAREILT